MATKNAERLFITVNGEKTLVTNSLMMEYAVAALKEMEAPEEIIKKAEMHLAQLSKKSSAPKTESRAAKENAALAAKVLSIMPEGETLLSTEIMDKVPSIMTTQKCTKVMQVLIKAGKVEKVSNAKGRYTGYQLM